MVVRRDALEDLVHVDGRPAVVERPRLPLLGRRIDRDGLLEGVPPRKIRIKSNITKLSHLEQRGARRRQQARTHHKYVSKYTHSWLHKARLDAPQARTHAEYASNLITSPN